MHGNYVLIRLRDDLVLNPYEVVSVVDGKRHARLVEKDDDESMIDVVFQFIGELA